MQSISDDDDRKRLLQKPRFELAAKGVFRLGRCYIFRQIYLLHDEEHYNEGKTRCVSVVVTFICCGIKFRMLLAGLSPDLQSMEQIRRIMRPTDVPDQGLLCDLLWSDPDKETMGWGENDRGVSFTFGAEVVAKFLHKHDLDLICRAHQVMRFVLILHFPGRFV